MDMHDLTRQLNEKNQGKIVMLVADGLGGLPEKPGGQTELEAADTPNLDRLAAKGVSGSMIPIKPGITPGSGPGHLGLFGYDPLRYVIGRGVLEATGIGFTVGPNDVAIRAKFNEFDQQAQAVDPVTRELIALSHQQVERARTQIRRTGQSVTIVLLLTGLAVPGCPVWVCSHRTF